MRYALFAALVLFAGCGKNGPKPLTVEEIPGALSNAFSNAKLLLKQNAHGIARQVQDKQYVPASIQLQALLPQELSEEQRNTVSAAFATLNQILQDQAASIAPNAESEPGKPAPKEVPREEAEAAAAAMQNYIRTK